MRVLAGLIAYNGCFILAGHGVLTLLGRRPGFFDAGLSFVVGIAVLLVPLSALATAGYVAQIPLFVCLALLYPIIGEAVRRRRGRHVVTRARSFRRRSVRSTALPLVFGYAVAVFGGALVRYSAVKPLTEWDGWGMWTLKARALIVFGNLPTADYIGTSHVDYPILVPMLQAMFFRFAGLDTKVVHVEYGLIALAFVLAVWRCVGPVLGATAAGAWALYALLLPGLQANVPDALADLPVAVYASLAAFSFASWLRNDRERAWLVLFAVFGSAALWTKNEGLSAILVIGLVGCGVSVRRPFRRFLYPPLVACVAVYVSFLPWVWWKREQGIGSDRNLTAVLHPIALLRDHARATQALDDLWGQLSSYHAWLGLPFLALGVAAVQLARGRDRRLAVFACLVPAGLFAIYVLVYAISTDPLGLEWLLATSSTRIVTSVGLISVALLPVQLSSLLDAHSSDLSAPVSPQDRGIEGTTFDMSR